MKKSPVSIKRNQGYENSENELHTKGVGSSSRVPEEKFKFKTSVKYSHQAGARNSGTDKNKTVRPGTYPPTFFLFVGREGLREKRRNNSRLYLLFSWTMLLD